MAYDQHTPGEGSLLEELQLIIENSGIKFYPLNQIMKYNTHTNIDSKDFYNLISYEDYRTKSIN